MLSGQNPYNQEIVSQETRQVSAFHEATGAAAAGRRKGVDLPLYLKTR
jgi:hypothetical protein